ncbi:hypothetical protein EW146_g8410 [Bondarzewia mesenterica]|uniref:Inosine/uridine-preferring nucleoside hydrolase domain-containing protein n=1 Tax=Bondarzewia mesenterica TaxID=1095465 RepID=A0A4S4LEK1_9AGAM|nr:hypothetical protein EW146_g8410 [Bondarzewia mesenterica]
MNFHPIWLDCDPGHDDATAILLAIHSPSVHLLGISTVHGNTDAENTALNAARCLYAFAAPETVKVFPGAPKPLLRPVKHDPEIHGVDGLGGVEGFPNPDQAEVRARLTGADGQVKAVVAMARAIQQTWRDGAGAKVSIVATGPLTNIALFVSIYPDLLDAVEQVVFMGGGVGVGNRSAVAEFNILCDPEAAQIVLNTPIPKTMIPLNVTHQAIVTSDIHNRLLSPGILPNINGVTKASSNLRHTLSTLISFFKESYKSTFGFNEGPPLHDALTVAYISRPDLFVCKRYRTDVELHGLHAAGETVVDVWGYRTCDDSWGATGMNCRVAEDLNVQYRCFTWTKMLISCMQVTGFFQLLLECISRCDKVSPLNHTQSNAPTMLDSKGGIY